MEIFVALAVIVTLILGVIAMTLARLAAAAAAISSGVARIGTEVTETTAAIRAHLEGDSGISQSALLQHVETLEAAGAKLTDAGNSLDALQSELGGQSGDGDSGGEPPASEPPAGDQPATDDQGEGDSPGMDGGEPPASDAPDAGNDGSSSTFGNQHGIGSDFEQGAGGDAVDLNSQSGDADQQDGDDSGLSDSDRPEDPGIR